MIIGAIDKTGGKVYGSFEEAAANVKNLLTEKQRKQNAQKQSVPKKDETLWGYSLAKCSGVGALKAVAGVAAVVGGLAYAAKRSKCF